MSADPPAGSGVPEFADWYRAEHPRVLAVLTAVSGEPDVASDATDEAFARCLERWEKVSAGGAPTGWTYTVALNHLRRGLRRRAKERRLFAAGDPRTVPAPSYDPEVWDAVRALPPRQRDAIVLRYVADLSEPDIAAVLRVSRGTVASTLHDARARLAERLGTEAEPHEEQLT
jgi:RNA polymerase sigma-70 factor (ECF subfamily)